MILSPNNTPILDIEEFTSKYPNHDYTAYFDSNGKDIKHNLFISMEEVKADEKFYNDIEAQLPSIWTIVYGDKADEEYQK